MKDLTPSLKAVYEATDIEIKRALVLDLIKTSTGKAKTKQAAMAAVAGMTKQADLDKMATNYMLSGEGMKVF